MKMIADQAFQYLGLLRAVRRRDAFAGNIGDQSEKDFPVAKQGQEGLIGLPERLHIDRDVKAHRLDDPASRRQCLAHDDGKDRHDLSVIEVEEVAMAVAQRTDLLRAASISSPVGEPAYYWASTIGNRSTGKQLLTYFGLGPPDTDPQSWKDTAVNNIAHIHAPLLMQMPENEMRVSMELYAKLGHSSTPVEMYGFANETHVKHQPRHQAAAYGRNLDWFRFWLKGEEDPDPAKADQYARWRRFASRPGYALPVQDMPNP